MEKKYLLIPALFIVFNACSIFKSSINSIPKPEMVFLKGGTFTMGDVWGKDDPDATPIHKINLSDFRIGKYEITYKQYDAFARKTGRPLPPSDSLGRGNRAVVYVSWQDAKAFCQYHGWRLPTEQEWEYAARSGGQKMKYAGTNNIDSLSAYARYDDNSAPYSYKVGSKKPNKAGLYDMSGNVFEWIGDYYQFYPQKGQKPKWDSLGVQSVKIMRGGSFREPKYISATYRRVGTLPEAEEYDIGFRCVEPLNN